MKTTTPLAISALTMMAAATLFFPVSVYAGDLTYRPINPSFGGDPFNSTHLLQMADIQNQYKDDGSNLDSLFAEETAADQFVSSMQNTMISGASSQLKAAIFDDGAPPSGTFRLNGATVTYETVNNRVYVKVSDGITTNSFDIPKPNTN
ncbi:curli assembly protein CsgF [Halomonas sp. I5-271120]|uniref:curli assembly protein CsgF n=1 Tax=Halomonas sp. I5-271120 TaxID=3061632 RepID=UPI00271498D2|nr:curli assembly protein CsgF [Halomonas sp. I5-271120]